MIIFVPHITPRITYIFDIIFGRLLGTSYTITENFHNFDSYQGVKIAYSSQPILDEKIIWIEATQLLFEEGVTVQPIDVSEWNGYNLFFPTQHGCFPIDIFAISFFLVTRYEEYYANIQTDTHNRFPIKSSVSYQLGFHRKPMVNILAHALADKIQEFYPTFQYKNPDFNSILTYDVDIAYKYKGKGLYRWCGSFVKSMIQFEFTNAFNLLKATLGLSHDDSFDRFHIHRSRAFKDGNTPIHFILTAPFSKFNKNIDPRTKTFKKLIDTLKDFSEIGLHPSYYSSENTSLITKEKNSLEKISQLQISKSRQHFLKLKFPSTFEALNEAGFKEDYSLGWQDDVGFRTSITIPVPFYNLITNQPKELLLFPLTIMDGALYKCTQNDEESLSTIETLQKEVLKYGGFFILLSHNNSEKHLF